jgi:hypothetical protein
MHKVAIIGKANSGKDTLGKILMKSYRKVSTNQYTAKIALADPVKEIGRLMFPKIEKKIFFGPSENRKTAIPNAFKNGEPLTVRQLLIDIGTGLGRSYNEKMWLDVFDTRSEQYEACGCGLLIVTDVRFRNEFDHVKNNGFFTIKLNRDSHTKINNISETDQDGIHDDEYSYILNNNNSLQSLKDEVSNKLIPLLGL